MPQTFIVLMSPHFIIILFEMFSTIQVIQPIWARLNPTNIGLKIFVTLGLPTPKIGVQLGSHSAFHTLIKVVITSN
jgi:hypothetical protein